MALQYSRRQTRTWPIAETQQPVLVPPRPTAHQVPCATQAVTPGQRVLDLACGSGEVWRTLRGAGFAASELTACDPYTGDAFTERAGAVCRSDSFADVANGSLAAASLAFDHVICAYALHLCETSRLPGPMPTTSCGRTATAHCHAPQASDPA